jgi:hypothetical protein
MLFRGDPGKGRREANLTKGANMRFLILSETGVCGFGTLSLAGMMCDVSGGPPVLLALLPPGDWGEPEGWHAGADGRVALRFPGGVELLTPSAPPLLLLEQEGGTAIQIPIASRLPRGWPSMSQEPLPRGRPLAGSLDGRISLRRGVWRVKRSGSKDLDAEVFFLPPTREEPWFRSGPLLIALRDGGDGVVVGVAASMRLRLQSQLVLFELSPPVASGGRRGGRDVAVAEGGQAGAGGQEGGSGGHAPPLPVTEGHCPASRRRRGWGATVQVVPPPSSRAYDASRKRNLLRQRCLPSRGPLPDRMEGQMRLFELRKSEHGILFRALRQGELPEDALPRPVRLGGAGGYPRSSSSRLQREVHLCRASTFSAAGALPICLRRRSGWIIPAPSRRRPFPRMRRRCAER